MHAHYLVFILRAAGNIRQLSSGCAARRHHCDHSREGGNSVEDVRVLMCHAKASCATLYLIRRLQLFSSTEYGVRYVDSLWGSYQ